MSAREKLSIQASCQRCRNFYRPDPSQIANLKKSNPEMARQHCTLPDGNQLYLTLHFGGIKSCPKFKYGQPQGYSLSFDRRRESPIGFTCPACGRPTEREDEICPQCRGAAQKRCFYCGKSIDLLNVEVESDICSECLAKIEAEGEIEATEGKSITITLEENRFRRRWECELPINARLDMLLAVVFNKFSLLWGENKTCSLINQRTGYAYQGNDTFLTTDTCGGDTLLLLHQ